MLIIPQRVCVRIAAPNAAHYAGLGHAVRVGSQLTVDVAELPPSSAQPVRCRCDVCGAEFVQRFSLWTRHQGDPLPLDTCSSPACRREKRRRLSQLRHGVDHPTQTAEVRRRMADTMEARLGVRCSFQSDEVRRRTAATNLARYGDEGYARTDDHHRKTAAACLRRLGMPGASSGTRCSQQQRFLSMLLGGRLNFPVGAWRLDVAWPERMVYLEYDGSGHRLDVLFGQCTPAEFDARERRRFGALCAAGWRLIRLVSPDDLLPDPAQLRSLVPIWAGLGHAWLRVEVVAGGLAVTCADAQTFVPVELRLLRGWIRVHGAGSVEELCAVVENSNKE